VDSNFHDHGGQPWAALQAGMAGQPFTDLARRLMDFDNLQPLSGEAANDEQSVDRDVRLTVLGLHLDLLAEEIAKADQLPRSDPKRIDELMALSKQQRDLMTQKRALMS